MDEFSIFKYSLDACLANLYPVLQRCEEVIVVWVEKRVILWFKRELS